MSKFGWDYPPGCNGTPFDEDHPCEVCGKGVDYCICPECPECGEMGNPKCYGAKNPHMVLSKAQLDSANEAIDALSADRDADNDFALSLMEEAELENFYRELEKRR